MVDIRNPEAIDSGITAFDQVIQDIREIREKQDQRSLLHRRARSADADIAPEESLPLFLSSSEDQERPPADPLTDIPQQRAWQPSARHQAPLQQSASQQSPLPQSPLPQSPLSQSTRRHSNRPQDIRYQDTRYQDAQYQDTPFQDTPYDESEYQDTWLHGALESDRERVKAVVAPAFVKRLIKTGVLTAFIVAALAALFTLEDRRSLITNASASLAAVLPAFSAGIGRPAPAMAKPQIAEPAPAYIAPAGPTPVTTVAVAPTREAIANAYQTALQSQPDIRQQPVAQPAPVPAPPPPAPAVRRLDPDELAGLLKRAQGLLDTGDLPGARLLLERAAGAHEAKAAFLLAQTYDPAVLGASDMRSTTPDPEAARSWYRKAAEFGSQEAQQRLAQMN
jgi:hypothetical protein